MFKFISGKKTVLFFSLGVLLIAWSFVIPQVSALMESDAIDPVYLGFKFRSSPEICIFGTDQNAINIGINSVLEWQDKLRNYTKNANAWNMTVTVNPKDISGCNTEIHFVKKPVQLTSVVEAQGMTKFQRDRAIIEVYTTQYYYPTSFKLVQDDGNKWRPVAGEFPDVPLSHLKSVTEHELGHVFGLHHQQDNSIMVTGYVVAHITDTDCQGVVGQYGKNWPAINNYAHKTGPPLFDFSRMTYW